MSEQVAITPDPEITNLRAMYNNSRTADEAEPKTAAPEPQAKESTQQEATPEPKAKTIEPESGTGEEKQEPEEPEVELPAGVKKRIAVEAAKQARIQSEIDKAVSARKAKEKELADVTGNRGSDPAKQPQPAANARPTRPVKPDWMKYTDADQLAADEAKYEADLAKYETDLETYLRAENSKDFDKRYAEKEAEKAKERWMREGVEKHGADFTSHVSTLEAELPEPLQLAVSVMDESAALVAYLGKNSDERKALVAKFNDNPYAAIAELGRLELKVKPEPKGAEETPKKPEKQLPAPLRPVGGGTNAATVPKNKLASRSESQELSDKGLMSEIRRITAKA